jgi:hypothetical protein
MNDHKVRFTIPAWKALLYIIGALVIIPWTIYLSKSLPTHYIFRHWDVAWVGLDIALVLSLLGTGILAYRKSLYTVIAASVTGSLLFMDAWFDVIGARRGPELHEAISAAVLLEVPIACLSFHLAYIVLHKALEQKK